MQMLFSKKYKFNNIISAVLCLLDIKYTQRYTENFYNEYHSKYSMYGIAKMLEHYGISCNGVCIYDKELALEDIVCPFIAHLSLDFILVKKIYKNDVYYT